MRFVDTVSGGVNYQVTTVDHVVKKITGRPSAVKKVLQLARKIFEAIDLSTSGQIHRRDITEAMKGTTDLIDFLGSYHNVMYWVNLFSKDSLDKETLEKSIHSSLCASHRNKKDLKEQNKIANEVFYEVMAQESYHSRGEVLVAIQMSLERHGYSADKAQQIAERVIIQQQPRSIVQMVFMACFTVADLGGNIMTLKKWHVLDLAPLAASIGSQSRVFMFVVKLGVDTTLGTIASAGLVLVVGEATYRSIQLAIKHYYAVETTEKEQAYQQLRLALLDLLAGTTDLVATAAPLLFALNPPVVVALAIVAKGTGIVCILIR